MDMVGYLIVGLVILIGPPIWLFLVWLFVIALSFLFFITLTKINLTDYSYDRHLNK